MTLVSINSLDDPRVAPYRDVKSRRVLERGDLFIAEGAKVVERLIASDFEVDSVLLSERRVDEWTSRIPAHVPIYVAPQELGEALVGFNFHVGVLACGRRRPIPRWSSPACAAWMLNVGPALGVVCAHCDNPENLGLIARLSAAFGARFLALGPSCSDPFSRRVIRVSMGAIFRLPVVALPDVPAALRSMHVDFGMRTFASVLDANAAMLSRTAFGSRSAIVLGNEAFGLDAATISACTDRVTIPMHESVDSLNVAMAAAILLHAAAFPQPDA